MKYVKSINVELRDYDRKSVMVFLVNDRYEIHSDSGICYDTIKGKDLPLWVFELREKLLDKKLNTYINEMDAFEMSLAL